MKALMKPKKTFSLNNEVESSFKTTVNAKEVQTMKKLQALYNNDANKIGKEEEKVQNKI